MRKIKSGVKIIVSAVALAVGGVMLLSSKDNLKNVMSLDMELSVSATKNGSVKSVSTYRITKDSEEKTLWKSVYGDEDSEEGITFGIKKVSADEIVICVSGEVYTVAINEPLEVVENGVTYQFTYNNCNSVSNSKEN